MHARIAKARSNFVVTDAKGERLKVESPCTNESLYITDNNDGKPPIHNTETY